MKHEQVRVSKVCCQISVLDELSVTFTFVVEH